MITNKDIRVENGSLIINGDPYPLDGQSPKAIMQIVKDNSDTTPTENSDAPVTSGGVYAAIKAIGDQLEIEHITNLVIDTSKITIGNYDCYIKAGVCYLSLYSCSFPASGAISASISNLPKSLAQALSPGYGSTANAADLISEYCWIAGDSTTMSFTVSEANKSKNRDYYLIYPVATS